VGTVRKVVAYELVSLDGVAEDPDAFILDWDDAMDANLARVIATQDTVLLGRRMYDEWSRFWPESDIQPFADFINNVEKHVMSSTPLTSSWAKTTVHHGDGASLIGDLKGRAGGDIGVHGSVELARSLLREGLIDELQLVVAPMMRASGRRLFDDVASTRLTLSSSEVSPSGYLLLGYQVGDRVD
jgi:dihydrofolate reductase